MSYLADKGSDGGSKDSHGGSSDGSGTERAQTETKAENKEIKESEPAEKPEQKNETGQEVESAASFLDVEREGTNQHLRLQTKGTEVEIENDHGQLSITAKQENRQEVELNDRSLDDINSFLEHDDLEISSAAGALSLRQRQTELDTHFPLSVDLSTRSLVVTTPAGAKTVAVLPDDAINNLLSQGILSGVESEASSDGSILRKATLGETGTTLSFTIRGITTKKFLGMLNRLVRRTVTVSAENGAVLSVDESFINRLLDLFSV